MMFDWLTRIFTKPNNAAKRRETTYDTLILFDTNNKQAAILTGVEGTFAVEIQSDDKYWNAAQSDYVCELRTEGWNVLELNWSDAFKSVYPECSKHHTCNKDEV